MARNAWASHIGTVNTFTKFINFCNQKQDNMKSAAELYQDKHNAYLKQLEASRVSVETASKT
eukprot:1115381-Rhodomonas_salina.1